MAYRKMNTVLVGGVQIVLDVECVECRREFNLTDENDADEYVNGHDCEV